MSKEINIPFDWFCQRYIKNGNVFRFVDKINQNNLKDLKESTSSGCWEIVSYCLLNMRGRRSVMDSMTIKLDWKLGIISNNKRFYGCINELVEAGFLWKLGPSLYLVTLDYICMLTPEQRRELQHHWFHHSD